MTLRALDLFCGAGDVSVGLQRAGFEVTGVDIRPQPHYRGGTFVQGDALEYPLEGFDFIWASPPCQAYSPASAIQGKARERPDLVAAVRARLAQSGTAWLIENVPGAPLRHGFVLCGAAFGLEAVCGDGRSRPLARHRLFEPSFSVLAPPCHCDGRQKLGVYGHGGGLRVHKQDGYERYVATAQEMREGMGIDWMTRDELTQAIPPAYAEWIGRQAMRYLEAADLTPSPFRGRIGG